MNALTESHSLTRGKILRNPHFWIIIAIFVTITIVYYQWQDWFPWFSFWFIREHYFDFLGILYFVPFLYSTVIYRWLGLTVVWALSEAAIIPLVLYYHPGDLTHLVLNIGITSIPAAVVIAVVSQLEWRRRQREMLVVREEERQTYISEMLKAQENERQRIAQELHDGATQDLLVIANRAQDIVSSGHSEKLKEREQAEWIRDAILQVVAEVRGLSVDLRPRIIDNAGLIPAIRLLAERLEKENGIRTRVAINGSTRKLDADPEVYVYRIVQEALNNIRRHSRAKEARIRLWFAPKSLSIVVEDNGVGFSLPKTLGSLATLGRLGLVGIDQRSRLLNGTCNIQSQLGKGTSVSIKLRC